MRRRDFIALISSATIWPIAAETQQAKIHRVGALLLPDADVGALIRELSDELRKAGFIEGQNLAFEIRSGEEAVLPKLASELVRLKVDVLVALYTPCAIAAQRATKDIPIVIMSGDPLGTGLVPSLGRPGGNITGVSLMAAELFGKCVELLRDALPSVRRVAALANGADPFSKPFLEHVQLAGKAIGIEIIPTIISGPDKVDQAFALIKKESADAVIVQGSLASKRAAELALSRGVPAVTVPRSFVDYGGLMSYGLDGPDSFRRCAAFVKKILEGARPGDLPVEQPSKFELVINLRTAKALGIQVPPSFVVRADEVIE